MKILVFMTSKLGFVLFPIFQNQVFSVFFIWSAWLLRNMDLAEMALWSQNSGAKFKNRLLQLGFAYEVSSRFKVLSFLKFSPSCLSFSFHFHFERHWMFMLFCCFGKTRLSFHDSRLYVLFHVYTTLPALKKQRFYGYASFLVISLSVMVYYGRYYVSRYHHPITES